MSVTTLMGTRAAHARSVDEVSVRLESLAANPPQDAAIGYSQAACALYEVNILARSLELEGFTSAQIVDSFTRIRSVFSSSPLGRHMQTWPSGYCGDFGSVEYIAAGINQADPATFAFLLEQAMLHSGIVQQHRYKLHHQAEVFLKALLEHQLGPRMLSIGCGGCRDLLPLLPVLRHFEGELVLNDIDPAALDFAGTRLSSATTRFTPICSNVLSAVRLLSHQEPFHLVVAGGLFDYLPDRLAVAVLKTVFHYLLAPGGTFFFTNIANGNPFRPLMSSAVSWPLIERSQVDLQKLCAAGSVDATWTTINRDESALTFLIHLRKPK